MPEKEPWLWGVLASLLLSIYAFLGKRVYDLPKNYIGKLDYKADIKELKETNLRLEDKVEKGLTRIYDKMDERRNVHRNND